MNGGHGWGGGWGGGWGQKGPWGPAIPYPFYVGADGLGEVTSTQKLLTVALIAGVAGYILVQPHKTRR